MSPALREFVRRSWGVMGANLLGSLGLLYALGAIGRHVGDEALAASGLVITSLNMVAVLGAGHGIRLLHTYYSSGPDPAARLAAVTARAATARDASYLLAVAWLVVGSIVVAAHDDRYFIAAAWLAGLPIFLLAPRIGLTGAMMQVADSESVLLRFAAGSVVLEVLLVTVLPHVGLDQRVLFPLILLSGQLATAGVLVLNRRHLARHHRELWRASLLPVAARPFRSGWRSQVWQASFTAWDALAIMGYYTIAVAIAGGSAVQVAAVVGVVASTNRTIIVPLKAAGLVGGRLAKRAGGAGQATFATAQVRLVGVVMVVAAVVIATAGQFSDRLFGVPTSIGGPALLIASVQLLMEPFVGFLSGQGKVLHGADFGVRSIVAAILVVALPLMLVLSAVRPEHASSYLVPFVLGRLAALVGMRRETARVGRVGSEIPA
ncbi:MAG: hypothetical protein L0H93_18520 [Nocardioides sp.]|nr:hypothetical protein [Nocardioides sp.]